MGGGGERTVDGGVDRVVVRGRSGDRFLVSVGFWVGFVICALLLICHLQGNGPIMARGLSPGGQGAWDGLENAPMTRNFSFELVLRVASPHVRSVEAFHGR